MQVATRQSLLQHFYLFTSLLELYQNLLLPTCLRQLGMLYLYVGMYACVYVCMYVCMCVYIYTHTHTHRYMNTTAPLC